MAISFANHNGYERFQVRVMRHCKSYSKTFSCSMGKQNAFRKAKHYESRLITWLDTSPMTSAGRHRGPPFQPRLEMDNRWKTLYVAVPFRRENGVWSACRKAISTHGYDEAVRLAVAMAKRRHVPHPGRVRKKKMPSKTTRSFALP